MPTRGRRRPWPYTEESINKVPLGRSMIRCVSLGPAGVVLRPRTILTRCALLRGSRARLSLRFRTENTVGGWYGPSPGNLLLRLLARDSGSRHPLTFGVSLRYFTLSFHCPGPGILFCATCHDLDCCNRDAKEKGSATPRPTIYSASNLHYKRN